MVKPDFIKENNVYLGKIEKNLQSIEEWANNCKAANKQSHKIEEFLNFVFIQKNIMVAGRLKNQKKEKCVPYEF